MRAVSDLGGSELVRDGSASVYMTNRPACIRTSSVPPELRHTTDRDLAPICVGLPTKGPEQAVKLSSLKSAARLLTSSQASLLPQIL